MITLYTNKKLDCMNEIGSILTTIWLDFTLKYNSIVS